MSLTLRIGSRPSALALAQATLIKRRLEETVAGLAAEIVAISTSGDRMASASLACAGGKGLFVKELEQALADGRIDIAVHSMKDLPALTPAQCRIAAVPERENPADVLITRTGEGWGSLARGARLGTSSTRRKFQALRIRPELDVVALRGNVDTRLKRLVDGDFDAIILAMAGLKRLGKAAEVKLHELDQRDFVPSGGQGALAVEALATAKIGGSDELEAAVAHLNDARSIAETGAERAFLATIGASCVSPVGVKATAHGDALTVRALLFSTSGLRNLSGELSMPCRIAPKEPALAATARAAAIGEKLGQQMLARGAGELIDRE
jgi:hydroxymethylbilane synthase